MVVENPIWSFGLVGLVFLSHTVLHLGINLFCTLECKGNFSLLLFCFVASVKCICFY